MGTWQVIKFICAMIFIHSSLYWFYIQSEWGREGGSTTLKCRVKVHLDNQFFFSTFGVFLKPRWTIQLLSNFRRHHALTKNIMAIQVYHMLMHVHIQGVKAILSLWIVFQKLLPPVIHYWGHTLMEYIS